MRTPVPDYLSQVLDDCFEDSGEVADYIPELAAVDPDRLGLAMAMADGAVYGVGDSSKFTIQSMSKPFVYALALADRGLDAVLERVGVDPSGDPFNEISLEQGGRPRNPMINIGAIVTHAIVGSDDMGYKDRFDRIKMGLERFAAAELTVDAAVFVSEFETSFRNQALANMVRTYGMIRQDPRNIVREYTRQCAISVTVRDLAVMGATLANMGKNPVTGEQVVEPWVAKHTLSVMLTCGMYDATGDWMTLVGMPAKSGVSGGIFGVLPGQAGIAAFSPRLDPTGTSVRAANVFRRLSADMNLHMMETSQISDSPIRDMGVRHVDGQPVNLIQLQGSLNFATMEYLLRRFQDLESDGRGVVVDISRVTNVNAAGHRMLLEGLRRLQADGHHVTVVDPDGDLQGADVGTIEVVEHEPVAVSDAIRLKPFLA